MRRVQYLYYSRMLLPFTLGIIAGKEATFSTPFWWYTMFISSAIWIILWAIRNRVPTQTDLVRGVFIYIITMVCGGLLVSTHIHKAKEPNHFAQYLSDNSMYIEFKVVEMPKLKGKTLQFYADIKRVYSLDQKEGRPVTGRALVYCYNTDSLPQIGQTGRGGPTRAKAIPGARNPGGFNMAQFYLTQGITHQIQLNQTQINWDNSYSKSLKYYAMQTQKKIQKQLTILFNPEYRGFAQALLLGDKSELNPEILSSFSKTGTMHVLAVSGLHAGIMFIILNVLLRFLTFLGKPGKATHYLCIVSGLWFYAFITGLPPSVMRAALMLTLVQTALILQKRSLVFNNIFASALVFLIINPMLLFHVGFQLSYSAVIGILAIQPALNRLWDPPNRIAGYFWDITTVSIAAQAATLPVSLFYFHQMPLSFLAANLVVIPAILILMITLIATALLGSLPFVGYYLVWSSEQLISALQSYSLMLESLPYSYIEGIRIDLVQVLLFYGVLFGSTQFLYTFKRSYVNLTLFILLLVGLNQVINEHQYKNQSLLIALYTPNSATVAIIEGKKATLITDSTYAKNEKSMSSLIEGLKNKYALDDCSLLNWNNSAQSPTWLLKQGFLLHQNGFLDSRNPAGLQYYNSQNHATYMLTYKEFAQQKASHSFDSTIVLNHWIALN